jgi:predicted transcriptional regulator
MAWRGDSEVHNREIEMKRTVRERESSVALRFRSRFGFFCLMEKSGFEICVTVLPCIL